MKKQGVVVFLVTAVMGGFCPAMASLPTAPGQWGSVGTNTIASLIPNPVPQGNTGQSAVTGAWNSGAVDPNNSRLIVWGGGHMDYSGNELYSFDFDTLMWSRLTNPSAPTVDTSHYSDGTPSARHTYDQLEYLPHLNSFCAFGATYVYGRAVSFSSTDCFSLSTNSWMPAGTIDGIPNRGYSGTALDSVTEHIWLVAGSNNDGSAYEYDPETNAWTTRYSGDSGHYRPNVTVAIDPVTRRLIVVGDGYYANYDISDPTNVTRTTNSSGGSAIVSVRAPGLDYDPVGQRMVAYGGRSTIYYLNTSTNVWTQANTSGVTPTAASATGTYNRFRYVPGINAFAVVNGVDQPVYVFRASDTPGPGAQPSQPSGVQLLRP